MSVKTIYESPSISDTVLLSFPCPGVGGCFQSNPYKVDRVVVFFVERDISGNPKEFDARIANIDMDDAAIKAEAAACASPTVENLLKAQSLRQAADSAANVSKIHYNDAIPVATFGNDDFPAWLSTDTDNAILKWEPYDANGNLQYGYFSLEWTPLGMREGDYFACWTWTPNPAGDKLSNYQQFYLQGDTQLNTTIPSHQTDPQKYEMLLERYLPEMFKYYLSDDDLTPDVIQQYHKSVGRQFTDVENLANQLIDLQDANATHEAFLPLLGNMFNLKLKSEDPTLWRRQIKQAVPNYKQKGTFGGLKNALAAAGITLNKVTPLWQVVSKYTWQESWLVTDESTDFALSKTALTVDPSNFGVWVRNKGSETYTAYTQSDVGFYVDNNITYMTWLGATPLETGDVIKLLYLINVVPGSTEQTIENYVRTLPLMDDRDELDQEYPPKNWNVRLIEEDDPLFGVVVASRHPYSDPVTWGKIRTEFPYSENAYNMDEFNGSTRDSLNPCDIDKNFLDECSYCRSSKFNIDVDIENLSDHRIIEVEDTIREMVPFHAQVNSLNFSGGVTDIIQPPVESIQCLMQMQGNETVVAGAAQTIFNRAMKRGLTTEQVTRSMLASAELVATDTGTGYNSAIYLYSGSIRFDRVGLDVTSNLLEVFSPSAYAGSYSITDVNKNTAKVNGSVPEPLDGSLFTFRLSNLVEDFSSGCSISPNHIKKLFDSSKDFGVLGTQSQWDVNQGLATTAWTVIISGTPYTINNVMPDGSLLLNDPSNTLPTSTTTSVSYTLKNPANTTITTGSNATLDVSLRGLITLPLTSPFDVRNIAKIGFYARLNGSGNQYAVTGYVENSISQFYVDGYSGVSASGIQVEIFDRLADNLVGNFSYQGMEVEADTVTEAILGVLNGANAGSLYTENDITESDHFKENFLIDINGVMYLMADINGSRITLSGGQKLDWSTSGTAVTINIYNYTKTSFTAGDTTFGSYDRRGDEIIVAETDTSSMPLMYRADVINKANNNVNDEISQTESISYLIEYSDGRTDQGDL